MKVKKIIITKDNKMINVNHKENGKHWTKKISKFRALHATCLRQAYGSWEASIFYPWAHFRNFFENIEKMERICKSMNMIS